MFGKIQFEDFKGLTQMPQKAASAWSAFEAMGLVGARYIPLVYVGSQEVKGINHWFICAVTTVTLKPVTKIITLAINEFNGEYNTVHGSDKTIFE